MKKSDVPGSLVCRIEDAFLFSPQNQNMHLRKLKREDY